MWEEPIISGKNGSGAIFFAGCNMRCVFCQNYIISQEKNRPLKKLSKLELAEIMLDLERKGAHNINLVSPMHYALSIKDSIIIAKKEGLKIPICYNTNSYELKDTLSNLDGLIDIYLADIKYKSDFLSIKYSKTPNYFNIAMDALEEMYRQVGEFKIEDDLMKKGIIVRILLLPGELQDKKLVLKSIFSKYENKIFYSLMNQYTPMYHAKDYPEINKYVSDKTYNRFINYAIKLGVTNGFIQEKRDDGTYTPEFNLEGL